ncbi:hypothetical protein [Caulobacter phage Cr30]|uniref:hypothetical protein n=1 Tax=Caulobacter phage Cr30 TaxID=1357714 RepID=UPI0004A9B4E3|nr:hypothetical protein OZ74_gp150 [Caulobacter phage Cr30]AGS81035.1 hypothetical protein [Caulobacter phage Cr30]
MSKKLLNFALTNDIAISLYESELKGDGSWWEYQEKPRKYFDLISEKRIVENLKVNIFVFIIGKYFVAVARFKNK